MARLVLVVVTALPSWSSESRSDGFARSGHFRCVGGWTGLMKGSQKYQSTNLEDLRNPSGRSGAAKLPQCRPSPHDRSYDTGSLPPAAMKQPSIDSSYLGRASQPKPLVAGTYLPDVELLPTRESGQSNPLPLSFSLAFSHQAVGGQETTTTIITHVELRLQRPGRGWSIQDIPSKQEAGERLGQRQ